EPGYVAPPAPPPPPPPTVEQEPGRKPMTAIALVVGALLLAGGGTAAALIITGQKDKPVAATPAAKTETITTPAPAPQPTTSSPQPAPAAPDTATTDALDAQQALRNHWQAIENKEFARAYDDYVDPSAFPDRSGWISSHEQAGIQQVILHTKPGFANGDTATVRVTKLVTFEGCGAK